MGIYLWLYFLMYTNRQDAYSQRKMLLASILPLVLYMPSWHNTNNVIYALSPLKTMNFTSFEHKFLKLCRKNSKKYPLQVDIRYFYDKYEATYKLIKNREMARQMIKFTRFSHKRKLVYREILAEDGIELTPDQVDYYIYLLIIILKDKYDIDT